MKNNTHKPLYLLPFDHRLSYVTGMFNFKPPLNPIQRDEVADSKQLIYEGFQQALADGVPAAAAALLVDEEFGAAILRDAVKHGFTAALSVEKSGSDEFEFEYGEDFARHIEEFNPTFAKILVRYNPEDDAAMKQRQTDRIRRLSDYCRRTERLFMFELLVPATPIQMESVGLDKNAYDEELRPELMARAIRALQNDGIEPDVWKIEGLDRRTDCQEIASTVQRGGRDHACCIILGRGANEAKVSGWLKTAAGVPGFIGFAVGRTSFWDAVADYRAKKATRHEACARIAKRYTEWVDIFEQAHSAQPRP